MASRTLTPIIRTREAAERFLRDVETSERAHPCCYGHIDADFDAGLDRLDEANAGGIKAARKLWGLD